MNNKMNQLRNIVVFGIILLIVLFALNFILGTISDILNFDSLMETNTVLYGVIIFASIFAMFCLAMLITKKLISIKIKISFKEAKSMLLVLLIIAITWRVVVFISSYSNTLEVEKELESAISEMDELKANGQYNLLDKSSKENANYLYDLYVNRKDEFLEYENRQRTKYLTLLITYCVIFILCIYLYGLFLYRNE